MCQYSTKLSGLVNVFSLRQPAALKFSEYCHLKLVKMRHEKHTYLSASTLIAHIYIYAVIYTFKNR